MTTENSAFIEIAARIIPSFEALAKDDKAGKFVLEIVQTIKKIVGPGDPAAIEAVIAKNAKVRDDLERELVELANRKAERENEALEAARRAELKNLELAIGTADENHRRKVDLVRKEIESTEAARAMVLTMATSDRWWISAVNPIMSVVIPIAFIWFLYLIAAKPIESGQHKDVFLVVFGALATAFATVVGFHFGSSSGSKRKSELQRLYGTRGLADIEGQTPSSTAPARQASSELGKGDPTSQASHPFEAFWLNNLSHIEHFNWKELLFKGESNVRFNSNKDPDPSLYPNVIPLVNVLEAIRKEVNAPIKLLSIYRSPEYNRDVGGATSSRHMQFDAADFQMLGDDAGSPERWHSVVRRLRDSGLFKGGIGIYKTFVHVDTRGANVDWDNR